jgi:hypothetical protein
LERAGNESITPRQLEAFAEAEEARDDPTPEEIAMKQKVEELEALLVEKVRENRDKVERVLGPGTKELYRKAIAKWGTSLEIDCVIEEMAELAAVLIRHRRGRNVLHEIPEEIADVRIMLDQLELIYGCEAQVEDWRTKKLNRLAKRVEGEAP